MKLEDIDLPQALATVTDRFCSAVDDLKTSHAKLYQTSSEKIESIEKVLAEVVQSMAEMPKKLGSWTEVDPYELKHICSHPDSTPKMRSEALYSLVATKPVGPEGLKARIEKFQALSDQFYLVLMFRKAHHPDNVLSWSDVTALKSYHQYEAARKALFSALDTVTAGEGLEWVPIGMSARIIEKVALELRLAGQFETFPMPTASFDWPFETALPVAKVMAQQTGLVDPYSDAAIYAAALEAYAAGKPTANTRFTVSKLRAFEVSSREFLEDAIIATLPWLERRIAYAIGSGWEDAVLNGDKAGTHFDNDVTGTTNVRTALDGLRDYVLGAGGIGAAGTVDFGGTALGVGTIQKLRSMRGKMGVFGVDLQNIRYVASTMGAIHILNLPEVLTVDKYGPNATIVTGELARIDASPVVLSGYQRDDVAASGKNEATGNDFTSILAVNRMNWMWGTRAGLGVETERIKLTDQQLVIMYDRRAFEYVGPATDPVVVIGVNIPNTL